MREPRLDDLIQFICWVQPELDALAAARLLEYEDLREGVACQWRFYREYREVLLESYLAYEELDALKP